MRASALLLFILLQLGLAAQAQMSCRQIYSDVASFAVDSANVNPRALIQQNLRNLLETNSLSQAKKVLKKISQTGSVDLEAHKVELLKVTRKYVAILRSSLQVATATHKAPKDFAAFVRDFGRLNDLIAEGISAGSGELAKAILKKYEKVDFEKLDRQIDYGDQQSIHDYFASLKHETQEILRDDMVSVDEYHEIRKNLKEYLNYYRILSDQSGTTRGEYGYLYDLNIELGEFNDQLTAQVLRGERKKTDRIRFPSDLRGRVDHFMDQLQII